jgi:hypothetical protein
MSKIHNMVRTIGRPGTEEFDLPKGWKISHVVPLGETKEQARAIGTYIILYVLVPDNDAPVEPVRRGRPPSTK